MRILADGKNAEYVKCDESMRQEYQRRVNHSNAVRDGGQRIRRDAK